MRTISDALQLILPFLYAGMVWTFASAFFRAGEVTANLKRAFPMVVVTVVLHAVYIGAYTLLHGRCLLATGGEISSLIAFTLAALYLAVEYKLANEASGTGFLVASLAFIFQTISSISIDSADLLPSAAILKDPQFNIHVTSAVFGYAALSLATIYGALYLLLFRVMASNAFGPIFEHLPSLERLERYGLRATLAGFIFLSIAIALGWLLMRDHNPDATMVAFFVEPKLLATVLAWAVFGVTLLARRVSNLEGRKLVILWMSGFGISVITLTLLSTFGVRGEGMQ